MEPMKRYGPLVVLLFTVFLCVSTVEAKCRASQCPNPSPCQEAFCQDNACATRLRRGALPFGCCSVDADCLRTTPSDSCSVPYCDVQTNSCSVVDLCPDEDTPEDRVCASVSDCESGSKCRKMSCINSSCVLHGVDTSSPNCCETAKDCTGGGQCSTALCDMTTYSCVYVEDENCEVSEESANDDDDDGDPAEDVVVAVIGVIVLACVSSIFIVSLVLLIAYQAKKAFLG